jgi:hypothetical protein
MIFAITLTASSRQDDTEGKLFNTVVTCSFREKKKKENEDDIHYVGNTVIFQELPTVVYPDILPDPHS